MFPNLASPDQEFSDGTITYIPFTDGYDDGFPRDDTDHDFTHVLSQFKKVGSSSLSSILDLLVSRGQAVDCLLYTFMLPWAADVAHSHNIPSAQYWIQPATVFAMYYHYFNGYYRSLVNEHCKDPLFAFNLPGLQQPLQIRDLPTFITTKDSGDIVSSEVLETVKEGLEALRRVSRGQSRPKVLVNSFDELEADALFSSVSDIELIGVGPVLQSFPTKSRSNGFVSLFKTDEKEYMEWLDTKPKRSVVYVSFGSLAVLKKSQVEEISKGLKASGRPYLWVVRKDCRHEGIELEENDGMVVEWCSQVGVLNHPSVGCFVTHCGWNSTLESLVSGVPTVGVPQWSDQGANLMLMEKVWGTGVRSEVDGDGVLRGEELARCLDLVLGDEERGVELRRRAEVWKEKAAEAVAEGGSSDRNLKAFVQELAKFD